MSFCNSGLEGDWRKDRLIEPQISRAATIAVTVKVPEIT
jgi:hypothetical protein